MVKFTRSLLTVEGQSIDDAVMLRRRALQRTVVKKETMRMVEDYLTKCRVSVDKLYLPLKMSKHDKIK